MMNFVAEKKHPSQIAQEWSNTFLSQLETYVSVYESNGKSIEDLSNKEKDEYRLFALNLNLKHLFENNTFYKEKLVQAGIINGQLTSLEQLSTIPFLEKDVIRGNKNILRSVPLEKICQYHLTSGTTGKPIFTAHTLADQYYHDAIINYPRVLAKHSKYDVVGIALPYELAQPALGFQRMYQFSYGDAVISLGKGGYMAPVDKTIEALRDFEVSILVTTPSYAALLAEEAEKMNISISEFSVTKLVLTGEGCSPTFSKRLKDIWNCEIQQVYGSTECGMIGIQNDGEEGYYLLEGGLIIEIVDPITNEPVAEGEIGEIVITTLLREATPFLRYKSGDLAYIETSENEDLVKLTKIHLRGRIGGEITVEGISYSPLMLEHCLLLKPEIGLWYRFIVKDEQLIIEIEAQVEPELEEEFLDEVKRHMYSTAGVVCEVVMNPNIPRQFTKAQRVFFE